MTLEREIPGWFPDAKFGIFVHWGAYSVPAWATPIGELGAVDHDEFMVRSPYAEWYANTTRIPGSPAAEHHARVHGGAPYESFLDAWGAERFDPSGWASLFAGVGARYVVLVTKHHDGICLWDAPGSGTYNAVARGPRRDLVADLAGAVRGAGLRFGTYYSGGLDWHASDLPPISRAAHLETHRPVDAEYAAYARAQLEDLVERYRPDVLWNDINWPDAGKPGLPEMFRRYYDAVPGGVVNDRWEAGWADFLTSEYSALADRETTGRPWEHIRGIGLSFGYNANETAEHHLTGPQLAHRLVDIVTRGGNLLLNVGPRADGTIPDEQLTPLRGLGEWLAAHGEAVYGTRPWAGPDRPGLLGWTATDTHVYAHLAADEPDGYPRVESSPRPA
ncbi:alpha-L-fucosidase [Jiangella anatolica]|uniref:alpha-L-fucosidase n=1 Tax=Jiangella anatolica TaxID=2670374 RepID=A0A2W2BFQ7_9ACTN|nr:alpha-L-fucosidase [Jiangella anatolica]PZF84822.1 alpha-L-fucosidase [Jiangella anatolica]